MHTDSCSPHCTFFNDQYTPVLNYQKGHLSLSSSFYTHPHSSPSLPHPPPHPSAALPRRVTGKGGDRGRAEGKQVRERDRVREIVGDGKRHWREMQELGRDMERARAGRKRGRESREKSREDSLRKIGRVESNFINF